MKWPFSHPTQNYYDPGNLHYWTQNVDVPPVQPATIYGGYIPDLWEGSQGYADPNQFNPIQSLQPQGRPQIGRRRRRFSYFSKEINFCLIMYIVQNFISGVKARKNDDCVFVKFGRNFFDCVHIHEHVICLLCFNCL